MPSTKTSSPKPPAKAHYVRINSDSGMRVYATNKVLREIAPLLIQDSVMEAVRNGSKAKPLLAKFTAGRNKGFTVRVDPVRRETHVQMTSER